MVNLIVADDHRVMREALCEMLRSKGKFNVVGQAADGQELMELMRQQTPDLVIMDIAMPKLDGLTALSKLREGENLPPVLVLSADEGEKSIRAALKAGAKGYVPKHAAIDELVFAIQSIIEGKTYLSPSVTAALMAGAERASPLDSPLSVLTERETEILKHLADGKPNREIGKLLHISTRTVDTHRSNILRKLKVRTNAELVKLAITHGLISV